LGGRASLTTPLLELLPWNILEHPPAAAEVST